MLLKNTRIGLFIFFTLLIFSCKQKDTMQNSTNFSAEELQKHVEILASDAFMGRKPSTKGETKTINYLKNQFTQLGIQSTFQEVPLVEVSGKPLGDLLIEKGDKELAVKLNDEYVASSRVQKEIVGIKASELVFAGYGIIAPEYNWNDYKDLDVKGKTVVVIVNDPGIVTGDTNFFKGNTMTYYGRWTYKYEEAARQGAKGCIIIHDDKGAGYNFSIVKNGATFSTLYLQDKNGYKDRCEIEGWITTDAAKKIFAFCNLDFEKEKEKAATKNHKSKSFNAKASSLIKQNFTFKKSNNVLGYIEGAEKKEEHIIFSAHWDHFGIGPKVNGDSIYNGAIDNGTSIAWVLETAKAFSQLKQKPKRSVLFFFPTAEEAGLLGSAYYTKNPIYPIEKAVAIINNDLMFPYGKTKDIMVTGYGQSTLEDILEEEAKKQNRYLVPDPNSHTGMFFRSDHFSFAKMGVPALFARSYHDHIEKGKAWMQAKEKDFLTNKYHKATDEVEEDWDLSGIALDSQLLFDVGLKLVNSNMYPKWKDGSEFKNIRSKVSHTKDSERGYRIKVGEQLTNFSLNLLNGTTVTNASLKNKVVVLQFTASWCGVCREEMPHLEKKVWQKYKDKDFVLIGIDLKEKKEKVKLFIKQTGITYPMGIDIDGSIFEKFTLPKAGVTRNIVLDKNGKIIFLTRLFNEKEFNTMIEVIDRELKK